MKKGIVRSISLSILVCVIASLLFACNSTNVTLVTQDQNQPTVTPNSTAVQSTNGNVVAESTPTSTAENLNANQKKIKAKGLYLTGSSAASRLDHYIELANTTEINSYVIDLKDDYGIVSYDSKVPLASEIGAIEKLFNIDTLIKKLHENNIYAIARIVCFKDPILAKAKPEMAIKNTQGGLYVHNKMNWVNPYNKDAWQYNIDLAKEALAKGFDEVQFDYIRFPDGKKSQMVFDGKDDRELYEVVNDYLAYARQELPNAIISGDVFAIILESPGDTEGIGQYFEYIGKDLDYLCPMAYPSHYANGQIINNVKFPKPDLDPYGVIKNTLLKAKSRYEKVQGDKPILRTYLQDFTATWIGAGNWQYYEDEQIRQEIQAVYDAGYEEWFLWDPMNKYREGAFKKE
ncbi:putative glycoside hydrolase [Acetivibrio cellulolyticus]|uniref:putative glycoside hydrolase n=1 Tax=Acetivibrio cellulolyticus TaxID=35830 RepID=UPI0001E2E7A3|nr:putative glycoside hydrolase [Acetivibrio cellulolyticus]